MSDPERHHYLPVFYLKQWAALDGRVIRYYRPHDQVVASPISPKHTGYEDGLYSLDGYGPEQRNAVEKHFMGPTVDDPATTPLHLFIERRSVSELTLPLRQAWVRFMMSLHVRNPSRVQQITVEAVVGLRRTLLDKPEEYAAVRDTDDPQTLLGWVERYAPALLDNYGKQLLPGIITHQAIGNEIIRMHWGVLGFSGALPDLLTCDRPLHLSHGIADPQCLIALPLSPRAIFFASRSQERLDGIIRSDGEAVLRSINEVMVAQAERYVYGAHERHRDFVEQRLRSGETHIAASQR
jgi:hypothetical protein